MGILENYKAPTPVKWRKIGDSILLVSTSMSTMVMGLPITEHQQLWLIFSVNAFGVIGKVITNLFKEDAPSV
jgi:hypothetical protein